MNFTSSVRKSKFAILLQIAKYRFLRFTREPDMNLDLFNFDILKNFILRCFGLIHQIEGAITLDLQPMDLQTLLVLFDRILRLF